MSAEIRQRGDGPELVIADKDLDMIYVGGRSISRSDFAQIRTLQDGVSSAAYLDRADARALRDFLNKLLEA